MSDLIEVVVIFTSRAPPLVPPLGPPFAVPLCVCVVFGGRS